jgi:hypothetical protein
MNLFVEHLMNFDKDTQDLMATEQNHLRLTED